MGQRRKQIERAIAEIGTLGSIVGRSKIHDTPPEGFLAQPRFLNAVIVVETRVPTMEFFRALQAIERRMGRRRTLRNGPRLIDLDFLAMGREVRKGRVLTLPHPRLHLRRFVLAPLCDIAPRWRHPLLRRTAAAMLGDLPPYPPAPHASRSRRA